MLSPISFSGTFKVTNQYPNTNSKLNMFKNFAQTIYKTNNGVNVVSKKEIIQKSYEGPLEPRYEETLIVPDKLDKDIEQFCTERGIKFEKLYTHDLLDSRKISKRIKEAPKGYRKVEVDSKKLEEFAKSQKNNIQTCKSYYDCCCKDSVDAMLREGSDFGTTILRIEPTEECFTFGDYGIETLKQYAAHYGINHLNQDLCGVYLIGTEDDQYYDISKYTYFGLENTGMDKIPVYVDNITYKAGLALGLFKETGKK